MTHASSEEEIKAMRSDFGLRLSSSMAKYGPLCVGIDPHRKNLTDWGYNVDAEGAELFSMRMLQAMRDRAAAVKFQEPMFERYGPRDSRRSNECSTPLVKWVSSPSWTAPWRPVHHHLRHRGRILQAGRPLLADAITLLPYYGARSLRGLTNEALNNGRGVFIAP